MGSLVAFPGSDRPLWRKLVGAFLRKKRLEQGRILTEVAATAGVSSQYLSELERGRKEPSSEVISAVAGALGLQLLDVTMGVSESLRPASAPARAERSTLLLAA